VKTREDFEAFLESNLLPTLRLEQAKGRELHARRQAARLPRRQRWMIGGAGAFVGIALGSLQIVLLGLAVPFVIDLVRMSRVRGPAVMDVRTGLIRRVVEFWGPEFSYEPSSGVSRREVAASRLIPEPHDRFSSCDLVTGKHRGTAFRFSEVRLFERVEKKRERVVWLGLYLVADFNKSFEGRVFVLPDATEKLLGSVLGRALQSLPFGNAGRLIHMEDPDFERHFKVYGEDDHETRYVLSTSLMRRIIEFKEEFDLDVRLAFIDGRVHVALPIVSDFFGAPSIDAVTPELIRSWVDEIHYVTDILDDLDLDTRIWSS